MDEFERGEATSTSSIDERDAIIADHFIDSGLLELDDIAERQARLARIVSAAIVPRLMLLHVEVLKDSTPDGAPSEDEIGKLAHLVLSPDIEPAAAYVVTLKERGLSMGHALRRAARTGCSISRVDVGQGRVRLHRCDAWRGASARAACHLQLHA